MSSRRNHAHARTTQQHFSNAHFEQYYRHQLFSSSLNDDDRDKCLRSLLSSLSKPLPLTFRVTANDHAEITLNAMKRAICETSGGGNNGETPQLREISFLNDKERTFQIDNVSVNEEDLKTKHPSLHEFLTRANEGGDLSRYGRRFAILRLYGFFCECYFLSLSLFSLCLCVCRRAFLYLFQCTDIIVIVRSFTSRARRQELVSMIPVKLLDVQPHHLVLDSCASPGSKTSQILEVMLSKSASGAVVANDASLQRANLLTHRCYRLEAAAKNLLVIHHDAQTLPLELENTFDRILCDVPCSGDGTLRKSTDLWKKWSNSSGAELHPIQVNVATRALRLLKHEEGGGGGGRLVYSTCSLNPLENEAVVVELLERSRGAIRLVDCSNILPDLKRLPGLTKWSVQDLKTMRWYDTYDSYLQDNRGSRQQSKIKKSMFAKSNNHKHNLDRCFRIHPDLNDTGGFFVAVFEKVKPLPAEMIEIDAKEEQKLSRTTNINTKKWASAKIAPVFSVNDTNADFKAVMKRIKAKYGFDARKKEENGGMELVTRNNSDVVPKRLYCLSKGAKSILDKCNDRKNQHQQQKLRVLACGLCCFERQAVKKESSKSEENDCEFRFTQTGCELFQDSISKQVVRVSPKELESMLARQQQKQQTTGSNTSNNAPLCIDDKTKKKVLSECERGCVILAVRGKSSGSGNKRKLVEEEIAAVSPVTIACWFPPSKKNRSSDNDDGNEEEDVTLTLMCSKSEGEVRLERLREHLKLKLLN